MVQKCTGHCSKQQKITYNHGKIVNIDSVHSLGASSSNYSNPTIKNCLFGAVTLTKKVLKYLIYCQEPMKQDI